MTAWLTLLRLLCLVSDLRASYCARICTTTPEGPLTPIYFHEMAGLRSAAERARLPSNTRCFGENAVSVGLWAASGETRGSANFQAPRLLLPGTSTRARSTPCPAVVLLKHVYERIDSAQSRFHIPPLHNSIS